MRTKQKFKNIRLVAGAILTLTVCTADAQSSIVLPPGATQLPNQRAGWIDQAEEARVREEELLQSKVAPAAKPVATPSTAQVASAPINRPGSAIHIGPLIASPPARAPKRSYDKTGLATFTTVTCPMVVKVVGSENTKSASVACWE